MYLPPHFEEKDKQEIANLISAHPLATLVVQTSGGLVANHIPMLMEDGGRLIGHIALANDLHRRVEEGAQALAIFTGSDSYISPNWYPSKAETHKHVPTWNYQAVHVHGALHFSEARSDKAAVVGKLTKHFEQITSGDQAWKMGDAPQDYLEAMLSAIIAVELKVSRIEAKSKLSQNRDARDFDAVVSKMDEHGSRELASSMTRLAAKKTGPATK